jgi:hypothetical protein
VRRNSMVSVRGTPARVNPRACASRRKSLQNFFAPRPVGVQHCWTQVWQEPSCLRVRQSKSCRTAESCGHGAQQCCAPTWTEREFSASWNIADKFTAQQKRKKGHAKRAPSENRVGAETLRFFFDEHFDLRGNVAEHLDGHREFAQRLNRVNELHLTLVDAKALRL